MFQAGEALTFEISGTPSTAQSEESNTTNSTNNIVLIGAGGLGLLMILAGVWTHLRDRKRAEDDLDEDEEADEEEFESSEEVLDAIIALDDLYRAKKISESAYQTRRTELKDVLKGLM